MISVREHDRSKTTIIMRLIVFALLGLAYASLAMAADSTWIVKTDLWGNPAYSTLTLSERGTRLSGDIDGDPLVGTKAGNSIEFKVMDRRRTSYHFSGEIDGDAMTGTSDAPDQNRPTTRVTHRFSARLLPDRPKGPPRTIDFKPTDYANTFDPHRLPVLTIWPGDTVRTQTIDSGGVDATGTTRALYGNPQTGPFFIADARPGDALVVRIRRLRLNRDYADSLDMIVRRLQAPALAARATELGKPVRWKIDLAKGTASPETAGGRLDSLAVQVRPMLGSLAVAPGNGSPPISTGDTGNFGGNMDFNEVIEGNAVYLPVQQPGALLYLGDAHAVQGDGETSQYALETSMDVEFTVDLIKGKSIDMPRVESPTQIMVLGQAGSLDDALRSATTGMVNWLAQDYGLSVSESAQLLGSSSKLSVANLAGRSVGIAVKIDKAILGRIGPAKP
jgi:acetamidase/formamidase